MEQLTRYTSITGQACTGTNATFNLGPYLREVPVNPVNNLATVEIQTGVILGALPAPNNSHGWIFNVVTGELARRQSLTDTRLTAVARQRPCTGNSLGAPASH